MDTLDSDFIVIEREGNFDSILPSLPHQKAEGNVVEVVDKMKSLVGLMDESSKVFAKSNQYLREQLEEAGSLDPDSHFQGGTLQRNSVDQEELNDLQKRMSALVEEKRTLVAENAELSMRVQQEENKRRSENEPENNDAELEGNRCASIGIRGCLLENEKLLGEITTLKKTNEEEKDKLRTENSVLEEKLYALKQQYKSFEDRLRAQPLPGKFTGEEDLKTLFEGYMNELYNAEESCNNLMLELTAKNDELIDIRQEFETKQHSSNNPPQDQMGELHKRLEEATERNVALRNDFDRRNAECTRIVEQKDEEIRTLTEELNRKNTELQNETDRRVQFMEKLEAKNGEMDTLKAELEVQQRQIHIAADASMGRRVAADDESRYIKEDNDRLQREHAKMQDDRQEDLMKLEEMEKELKNALDERDLFEQQAIIYRMDFEEERQQRQILAGRLEDQDE